ncbi:MAG: hypothetical protein PHP53_20815 [Prolixibacteraceae bacterium]|nr:hypothetical protein [Prolixibacteraceae bacterium]
MELAFCTGGIFATPNDSRNDLKIFLSDQKIVTLNLAQYRKEAELR